MNDHDGEMTSEVGIDLSPKYSELKLHVVVLVKLTVTEEMIPSFPFEKAVARVLLRALGKQSKLHNDYMAALELSIICPGTRL